MRVCSEFPLREGDVIAVRVMNHKSTYNVLELPSGRMSSVKQGDVIAGALGHRHASEGYAGEIPTQLKVGDTINLLNMGGVLGNCLSYSPTVGPPFECEVLGQILEFPEVGSRTGVPANISRNLPALDNALQFKVPPILAVVGTCMNSGKTEACLSLIQELSKRGLKVAAAKCTGISLRRDILAMEDAGAVETLIFTDLGVVTSSRTNAARLAKTLVNRVAKCAPDVIVLELGDGLLGEYGVDTILADEELAKGLAGVALAANDPVAAWGGVRLLEDRFGIRAQVVTGPATDNSVGRASIYRETGIEALNARSSRAEFASLLCPLGVTL